LTTAERLRREFLELIAQIDFAERYYRYITSHRDASPGTAPRVSRADVEDILVATGLDFEYVTREHAFLHHERTPHGQLTLGIKVDDSVESVLSLKTKHGVVGGPFAVLARQVAQFRDESFTFTPRAPRLPFSTLDDLREAIRFTVELFHDATRVITSSDRLE
jgi:hypothetical protein